MDKRDKMKDKGRSTDETVVIHSIDRLYRDKQEEIGASTGMQIEVCKRYSVKNGIAIIRVFNDK